MSIVKKTFEKGAQKCTHVKKELRYKKMCTFGRKAGFFFKNKEYFSL